MKILIMGFGKLKFMPYMNFYLDNLNREEHDIHLLCWNRDLKPDITSGLEGITVHEFRCYQEDDVPKSQKVESFAKYRKFALQLLKKEKIDFIYVVHTLTGIVVWDYIRRHYKNRFAFDYRDVTLENNTGFRAMVADMIRQSRFTFVSSDAFRIFFPETENKKVFLCHNIDMKALEHRNDNAILRKSDKIRIGFWGFIRDYRINEKIIEQLGNDLRFELHYYGREQQIGLDLKKYAIEKGFTNVFFHGEYSPEDKYDFIKDIDLIHNIYDDEGARLAIGNKYYDGIICGVPQVCMRASYMGRLCVHNGVGFECNPYTEGFADELYNKYRNVSKETINENTSKALTKILEDNERSIHLINSVRVK